MKNHKDPMASRPPHSSICAAQLKTKSWAHSRDKHVSRNSGVSPVANSSQRVIRGSQEQNHGKSNN